MVTWQTVDCNKLGQIGYGSGSFFFLNQSQRNQNIEHASKEVTDNKERKISNSVNQCKE
jgi:hypothetical protein